MSLSFETIVGDDVVGVIEDVARLRIRVFRDFPYLYDGNMAYEAEYLSMFAKADGAVVIVARDNGVVVGAATGCPLAAEHASFKAPFEAAGLDVDRYFYCAESVLLPEYRGQGAGHMFFDLREAQARKLGKDACCFCAVERPLDHRLRPEGYRPLDGFWRKRGYAPQPGLTARFSWLDLGEAHETEKTLQFWMRTL